MQQKKSFSPSEYIPRKELRRESIEFIDLMWSELEPHPGEIDEAVLNSCIQRCQQVTESGKTICITFFNDHNPQWFITEGGFMSLTGSPPFQFYLRTIVSALGQYVDLWQPFKTLPEFQDSSFGIIRETRIKIFQANIALCQFTAYSEIHRQLGYTYGSKDGTIHYVAVLTPPDEPMKGWLQNVSVAKKLGLQISESTILDDSSIVSISSSNT